MGPDAGRQDPRHVALEAAAGHVDEAVDLEVADQVEQRLHVDPRRGEQRRGEARPQLGRLLEEVKVGPYTAVVPTISGQAWITGMATYVLDPTDPFPEGYTVGDIW